MTTTWIDPKPVDVPSPLRVAVGGHPLVAELLARKGIRTADKARAFLDPRVYQPASPHDLPDIDAAIRRLVRALQNQESVVIWGDFDVDGQTATAILLSTLAKLGLRASFYIPHRIDESHGLNRSALDELMANGADLILTCDCGISDLELLEHCRSRGLDVIVTDHHDVPPDPVPAVAAVNPKYLPVEHPLYELSGAGVAYKLAEALLAHFRQGHAAAELADLAALGTVADIVPLIADNRHLVQTGLPLLAAGQRVGISALARVANIELSPNDTESVGFALAPILNSSGRLASADVAVRLLTTDDRRQAEEWAVSVAQLNEERRYQTSLAENLAIDMVNALGTPLPPALVLASSGWHQGVAGIVAGRLAQIYHRPSVLISLGENGAARGSARSVAGIDIHHAIVQQGDLLLAEGGHPMAAGFALKVDDLEEFRQRLIGTVGRLAADMRLERTVAIEAWVDWAELSLGLCDDLYRLAPFGEGNRPPVLASRGLTISAINPMGDSGQHLRLRMEDEEGLAHDVVWWNGDRDLIPRRTVDMAYILKPNLYGGVRRLQLELVDLRRTPASPMEMTAQGRVIDVLDRRRAPDRRAELDQWLRRAEEGESVICWGEGHSTEETQGLLRRCEIAPADTLVVWTVPAGPDVLSSALSGSAARQIVLLCGHLPAPDVKTFLTELVGLIKFTIGSRSGQSNLDDIAGALAARTGTVLAGLDLLGSVGTVLYDIIGEDGLYISRYRPAPVKLTEILAQPAAATLRHALDETAAYRRFLLDAGAAEILPAGYLLATPEVG